MDNHKLTKRLFRYDKLVVQLEEMNSLVKQLNEKYADISNGELNLFNQWQQENKISAEDDKHDVPCAAVMLAKYQKKY